MNSLPKFVASDTLSDPAWNNTTVSKVADFPDLIRDLKDQPEQDIVQLHPLLCGKSEPTDLVSHHAAEAKFRLADVRTYDSGVVVLHYQPT